MAMFDNIGNSPYNIFSSYETDNPNKVSLFWNSTKKRLGDRISYMVYLYSELDYYSGGYVVDCLMGGETLGAEVADILSILIPKCKSPEIGRMIRCTDIVNPYQIPGIQKHETGHLIGSPPLFIREDERYLVAIRDEDDDGVHMYFFKKK